MKRSGSIKRRSPMARGRGVKPVNRKRAAAKRKQNFGDESEHVKAMPCAARRPTAWESSMERDCADQLTGRTHCRGSVVPAHVTARGMGAAKGGRFDIVPLCAAHHEEAGEARSSKRAAFEQRYGLDLRRLADDIALGMPEPLGIRGLALRFQWTRVCTCDEPDGMCSVCGDHGHTCIDCDNEFCTACWEGHLHKEECERRGSDEEPCKPLDDYERGSLFGWVDRRAERVWAEQPEAIGEGAVLAVLVTELGLSIEAAGDLLDAATEGQP